MKANFSSNISSDFTGLIITDTSPEDYESEVILDRKLVVLLANGVSSEIDFPIVSGVGDSITYGVDSDLALSVTLELTPSVVNPLSKYSKTTNILLSNHLVKKINDLRRKVFITDQTSDLDCRDERENISKLEKADGFFESAKGLISTDIIGANKAITRGNSFISASNCYC